MLGVCEDVPKANQVHHPSKRRAYVEHEINPVSQYHAFPIPNAPTSDGTGFVVLRTSTVEPWRGLSAWIAQVYGIIRLAL